MVYAVGIKITRHMQKTPPPPAVAVFGHFFPVIRRQAPVLSDFGKIIRRGSGLRVQMEQGGFGPGVCPVGGHADGNIAFERDAFFPRVTVSVQQLRMQQKLHIEIKVGVLAVFAVHGKERFHFFFGKVGMPRPAVPVCRAEAVAQGAEHGVRRQPVVVGVPKFFERFRCQHLLALFFISQAQTFIFKFADAFIIHLRGGV